MTTNTVRIGDAVLTRVGYADVVVPAEVAGLTEEEIRDIAWAEPTWADDGQLRLGAAAWVIESGDARIVVDPGMAADDILRNETDAAAHQEAFASLLAGAGFARESITHAVSTHVEGIGMLAWRNDNGSWAPFFPDAPLLVAQADLDAVDDGRVADDAYGALAQLRAQGVVQPVTSDELQLTPDVALELAGGHTPGHLIVRVASNGEHAVMVGHLAVSPLHFATGENPIEHIFPDVAEQVLEKLRGEDTVLIGPLWPVPGAGRWEDDQLAPLPAS